MALDKTLQIQMLRGALFRLMETTGTVRTSQAIKAHSAAHSAWIATTPDWQKTRTIELARSRDPSITDYEGAIKAFGSSLLDEVGN